MPDWSFLVLLAIRTAPLRGNGRDVVQDLRDEYRQKCELEDLDARAEARKAKTAERKRQEALRLVANDAGVAAQQKADQCAGMRDVIVLKRAREASLNAKEVAASRDLETAYNGRYIGR